MYWNFASMFYAMESVLSGKDTLSNNTLFIYTFPPSQIHTEIQVFFV